MSYPEITEPNFLDVLLCRKEFYGLKAGRSHGVLKYREGYDAYQNKYLKIHSHQLFVRNFMNPNTPYKRLHLKHKTGTGKTLAAVSIAQEFIKVYAKLYAVTASKMPGGRRTYSELDRATPTVFVLGFAGAKTAFIRELMKYPEFGFITNMEKDELTKRRKAADAGLPDDIKHLKEYYSYIKRRITNKSRGGFYKFFGYDEFVNRLFISDEVKLTDLEAIATANLKNGIDSNLEDIIREHIANGKIQINQMLLKMFENSIMICDEIHNAYNKDMKNNRGVAIQYTLDSVPSLRFLSLSATPINGSPTEVVELANFLIPVEQRITKKGFFVNQRTLLPGKLEELGRLLRGRISFLQDSNIKYFPQRIWMGKSIVIPKDIEDLPSGSEIPYLKFIECPMSVLHQETYNHHVRTMNDNKQVEEVVEANEETNEEVIEETEETIETPKEETEEVEESEYHTIPTDGYAIYDIVFPSPDSTTVGVFRSGEVRSKITQASQEWRDLNKISMKKYSALNSILVGDFLQRDNIEKYSTKLAKLLDIVTDIIGMSNGEENKVQKIMIYHGRVKMSGVLLIQEFLRANNFIDEYSEPVETTICCVCGRMLRDHIVTSAIIDDLGPNAGSTGAFKSACKFRPARFVVAHSDVDKLTMNASLEKFNAPDNCHGLNYMILLGSKIIKESHDFKDIQNMIVLSLPINIPMFIQVLGRSDRKHSHINLPPEQRRVALYILISTVNLANPHTDSVSPEVYRYVNKLCDYMSIQKIERELNMNSIDADINWDINMSDDLRKIYFPTGEVVPKAILGDLYFDPNTTVPDLDIGDLKTTTFNAYRYYEEEIGTISYIIKRLFIDHGVWRYDDLWAAVKSPPFGIETNPALFLEQNFIIALNNLVSAATNIISNIKKTEQTESFLIERLFDYADRYIYKNAVMHKIEQIGEYYIMFPIADIITNPLNIMFTETVDSAATTRIVVDVETYLRPMSNTGGSRISIDNYIKTARAAINYESKKKLFIAATDDINSFLVDYSMQFQMNFIEDAIIESIAVKLNGTALGAKTADVIDLMDKLRVIVYVDEVSRYKDTVKQFKFGVPKVSKSTPIGYITAKTIRLFDPQTQTDLVNAASGKWIEISKIALNRHMGYKENDIIIGYLEPFADSMRFKLRKPIQTIKSDMSTAASRKKATKSELEGTSARTNVTDTRLIERGIVCGTKNKTDLMEIIAELGISTDKIKNSDLKIKTLCDVIRKKIIDNEQRERHKDSKYKWLYSWWNELPILTP